MPSAELAIDRPVFRGQPGDRVTFASGLQVEIVARAQLPTQHGHFEMIAFENNQDGKDHVVFVKGDVVGQRAVPMRVHSECLTGDVFGSIKCDCRAQLEAAIESIAAEECGMIAYMRQEGRGIGLANKIRAYSLQDRGFDTVEANLHLGFDDDLRRYDIAAAMVHLMGVESVHLMTNNPRKLAGLRDHGVLVEARSAIETEPTEFNRFYLLTKKQKSGHLIGNVNEN